MIRTTPTRRRFLQGTAAAAGIGALAGCTGDGGDSGGGGDDDVPERIDDYLSNADEYDGTIEDATGESTVTVEVGAGSNGFGFAPAAVRADAGTTVRWEWTGAGGAHNVDSVGDSDFDFSSGDTVDSSNETYEQTFDSGGIALYECTPHAAMGMLGAVEVVE